MGILLYHSVKNKDLFVGIKPKRGYTEISNSDHPRFFFIIEISANQFKKCTISHAASKNAPTPKLDVEFASTTCPGMAFSPMGCT